MVGGSRAGRLGAQALPWDSVGAGPSSTPHEQRVLKEVAYPFCIL